MPSRVYDSDQRQNGLIEEVRALFEYRELVRQFVSRAINAV